ncbi:MULTISPECIES: ATP-binding protein [unclassified Sphingopyxis]|uniref:ATP-binding protein n=1 Tax=unclassified Sphingopyxis TaxID=2614943 RepID=UPI0007365A8F|nr:MULTISPECIES: ATP-binding protein [unclassified Sphingopyxis]KTE36431.1 hypothetical protein ATE62_14645 [Sphingopyxis sp. HIX]KTE83823.1 hypothetical protein ATE72_11800 [Sphingopyxis sp. HXXIV]
MARYFRISSSLKDIIGRDLITNDFVAVFELVKNSFDAHARRVDIVLAGGTLWIVDDGKGMSEEDLLEKWLFVAFSAKATGEEDDGLSQDFRDKIAVRRGYAGNKGIGRFSCDRLGKSLVLHSRQEGERACNRLIVNWEDFEGRPEDEFGSIGVAVEPASALPPVPDVSLPRDGTTILEISSLREVWDRNKLLKLKDYLAKLVDPFAPKGEMEVFLHAPAEREGDKAAKGKPEAIVNGPVANTILDVLEGKTTQLSVQLEGGVIHSTLRDRDRLIYRVREENPYPELEGAQISADLLYLNRSAKATFTRRMGIEPVKFGSVFLFLNGFRVFPIGEEGNDEFGIDRRKAQGYARYLGTRDLLGRIDIVAPQRFFMEASSRDNGLVEGPRTEALQQLVLRNLLTRLERYVVDVTWADSLDAERSDASGLTTDDARSRIIQVVKNLVGRKGVELLEYDTELIDTISDRAGEFERAMEGLSVVAERTGDVRLLERIERSRRRYAELNAAAAEAEAKAKEETRRRAAAEAQARAEAKRADDAEQKFKDEQRRSLLLTSLEARDSETLTLLHHQVVIYATAIQDAVANNLRAIADGDPIDPVELAADLEHISFQNSRILAVTRFATQANFKLDADQANIDIVQYMSEYVMNVASLFEGERFATFDDGGNAIVSKFKPIDIAIVIDNLMSNARKAKATKIHFEVRRVHKSSALEMLIEDNGRGIGDRVDRARIFDKGYSGAESGSGLGLYHAAQVLSQMGGSIALDPEHEGRGTRFIVRLPRQKD